MKVTRTSVLTGISRTLDVDIHELDMASYELGEHINTAMPHLSPAERAFILSGITREEWLNLVGAELPDDDPVPTTPPKTLDNDKQHAPVPLSDRAGDAHDAPPREQKSTCFYGGRHHSRTSDKTR